MKQVHKTNPSIPQSTNTIKTDVNTTGRPGSRWTARRLPGWVLLPLRLFLGITFVYAGIQKLTDPQYFNPSAPGYIGKQILGFAVGSPIHDILVHLVVPHAHFFGALVAYGELAIGIGTLLGLLLRPAAFFGMLLSFVFFLSASWRVRPYFYGADIVFVFSWITLLLAGPLASGLPSLDALLVPHLLMSVSPELRGKLGLVLNVLLGVGSREESKESDQPEGIPLYATKRTSGQAPTYNSKVGGYPQGVPQHIMSGQGRSVTTQGIPQHHKQVNYRGRNATMRRSQESRRNFMWGLLAGGLGMLGITFAGKAFHLFPFGGDDTIHASQGSSSIPGGDDGSDHQSNPGSGSGTATAQAK